MSRNRVVGAVGVFLGIAILLNTVLGWSSARNDWSGIERAGVLALAILLLIVGAYFVAKPVSGSGPR